MKRDNSVIILGGRNETEKDLNVKNNINSMSEELIKRGFKDSGIKIGEYEYYNIQDTTLEQLKQLKIIPDKDYGKYKKQRPDGLLVDRRDKENIRVIVSLEYKQPSDFKTNKQKEKAIQQCNDMCQVIGASMGVITDGQTTFWINPLQKDEDNNYTDERGIKRSYSFIRNEDKKDLSENFIIQEKSERNFENLNEETKNTLFYISRILECINENNSQLISTEEVDPLNLARGVWQDIYVNTGKDPTKCLYNVVELFIFKFLSDLGVLKDTYSFDFLMNMYETGSSNKDVLEHYAKNSRDKIRKLFPVGDDGTTIINGTIFVDSSGNPVSSQANLFKNSLKKYQEFGSLRHVKKEFKTKLFETFLKQSQDKSRLGQFFTPRKVVRAIVDMSGVENLPKNSRVCDPFCGVGGFILESLQKPKLKRDFNPKNGEINPYITYNGFDKGGDEEEERIIILAKANMLIYLSEIVENNPTLTKEFSKIFNNTFHLIKESNLGTLKKIIKKEENKYDLILTNPPYITSGVGSLKDEIKSEGLSDYYTTGSKGVEGLAFEWILRSLKKGGKAFVVIPSSILSVSQNKEIREYLLKEYFVNCLISLPAKTFFNTPQKTYILGITKKEDQKQEQTFPVFTYLVSNIGETLDVNRFEIEGRSDLEKAKDLFNSYKGSPETFPVEEIGDIRCKLQPINRFFSEDIWIIDKWWTSEEKIKLGIEEEQKLLTLKELSDSIKNIKEQLDDAVEEIENLEPKKKLNFSEIAIGKVFDFPKTNSKVTKNFCNQHKGNIPVYASSRDENSTLGFIQDNLNGIKYYENCLSWNRNGSVGYVFIRNHKFATNEDHRAMVIKKEFKDKLDKEYLKFEIENKLLQEGFSFLDKCGVAKIEKVNIKIPIDEKKEFSKENQKYLLDKIKQVKKIQDKIKKIKEGINEFGLNVKKNGNFKNVNLTEIFYPKKGSARYTKGYIRNHKGNYPLYSSQTKDEGKIGGINSFDYNCECLTWTTDGIYAGTVFYRNGKFSMTTHCGALILKEEFKGEVFLKYVQHELNHILNREAIGEFNKRVTIDVIKKISIKIPIKDNKYDFNIQKEIADKYTYFENLKDKLTELINEIINTKIKID